jgi:serine/threonine protein kinase
MYNAMDLYTESYLLTRLNHPNIIGIHGVVNSQLPDSYKLADGYFILLDIMQTTLMDELSRWRENKSRQSRSKAGIVQRLQHAMMPVVEAMQYLHRHDIVLRDLKPENIGFDETGRAKLFDFGLARDISVVEDNDIAGSICYMAPEIMLEEGTFFASDVYSFAIVLWELCTLQIPLIDFEDMEEVQRRVAEGNWRPNTSRIPSKTLRNLIKRCWHRDPKARPSFVEIEKELYKACNKYDHRLLHDSKNNLIGVETKGVVTRSSSESLVRLLSPNSGHSLLSSISAKV